MQRQLLYFPPPSYVPPSAVNIDMTAVNFTLSGAETTSWYAPPQSETAPVIMFFHGNGSAVYSHHFIFSELMTQGYGVMSVGYPGYPFTNMDAAEDRTKPSQDKLVRAALQNYEYLTAQGIAPERIVYMGTSLGTGIAAQLAARKPPSLLIMEAPFYSALDMGKRLMPVLPVQMLMKDKFQSGKALKSYSGPLIWMHGRADRIVPISQGQKLYDSYDGPKTAHIFEDGDHVNLWYIGGGDIVLTRLSKMFPHAGVRPSLESSED